MRLSDRLSTLEATLGQRPTATYKHARDLTDDELQEIAEGNDIGIRLIMTPAERRAFSQLTERDMQLIQKAVLAI